MKAMYEQKGDNWDYANPTNEIIEAGTLIVMGDVVGVAATRILPGKIGTVATTGVWAVPKDTSKFTVGEHVIYDEENDVATALTAAETTVGESEQESADVAEITEKAAIFIGVAIENASADSSTVLIKLNA